MEEVKQEPLNRSRGEAYAALFASGGLVAYCNALLVVELIILCRNGLSNQ
jgi:hypothetical protein